MLLKKRTKRIFSKVKKFHSSKLIHKQLIICMLHTTLWMNNHLTYLILIITIKIMMYLSSLNLIQINSKNKLYNLMKLIQWWLKILIQFQPKNSKNLINQLLLMVTSLILSQKELKKVELLLLNSKNNHKNLQISMNHKMNLNPISRKVPPKNQIVIVRPLKRHRLKLTLKKIKALNTKKNQIMLLLNKKNQVMLHLNMKNKFKLLHNMKNKFKLHHNMKNKFKLLHNQKNKLHLKRSL